VFNKIYSTYTGMDNNKKKRKIGRHRHKERDKERRKGIK